MYGNSAALSLAGVLNVLTASRLFFFLWLALFMANSIKVGLFVQKSSVSTVFHIKYYVSKDNFAKILDKKRKISYNTFTDLRRT